MRFCPDCGAECDHQSETCNECQFPLKLEVQQSGTRLQMDGENVSRWRRVAQLLTKNGMSIQTVPRRDDDIALWWWCFPIGGALALLLVMVFGDVMANALWPRDKQSTRWLDLQQSTREEARGATLSDTDPLLKALKASPSQKTEPQELLVEEPQRVPASRQALQAAAEQVTGVLQVGDDAGLGVVFSQGNLVLVWSPLLDSAFKRERKTITKDGSMVQDFRMTVPKLNLIGQAESSPCDRVSESPELRISLLSCDLPGTHQVPVIFDSDPEIRDTLFLPRPGSGAANLQELRLLSSLTDSNMVTYFQVSGNFATRDSGAPLLNAYAEVVGMLVFVDEDPCLLSMHQIRSKAPYLYKTIRDQ